MTLAVAGYISKLSGGFWTLESDSAPATPTLSLANDGNGTSATASITGAAGATHQLYYMLRGGTAWTAGLTRVGDGDIVQTGLTAGAYYFIVQSTLAGLLSAPSPLASLGVLSGTSSAQLEDAVYHKCADTAAIAALVSTRIYRVGSVPSGLSADYLSYQRITTARDDHQTAADSIADARLQFNCWAKTDTGAQALSKAVRDAFAHYSGAMGQAGHTVSVKIARVREEVADYAAPYDGSQGGMYRRILDVLIWYSE